MAVASAKTLMKMGLLLFRRGFNSSKCKTAAKMAVARIKLLRNKREVVVRQMRRDIALLLQSGQDATARIRVEHVIREQNVLAANEFIELFCELVVARLTIIAKQRECPADLKEGIASLIFAAPRCSEIPELVSLKNCFEKKYGKDFVSAATDLRPNAGVNRMLIDKLSVRTPSGEVKLKVMKEIAKEYQIDWDTTESEKELLKPPEELIEGPRTFVSASSLPVKPGTVHTEPNKPATKLSDHGERGYTHFKNTVAAAEAAAESAKNAIVAAEAAAYLANKDSIQATQPSVVDDDTRRRKFQNVAPHQIRGKMHASQSFGGFHYTGDQEETLPAHSGVSDDILAGIVGCERSSRRDSYNESSVQSDIKFDASEDDEEMERQEPSAIVPPQRSPPHVPGCYVKHDAGLRVHPKLPDYDALSARFEALKKSKP